jgi:hypothetical protein
MKIKRSLGSISIDYKDDRPGEDGDGKATLTVIGIEMNCPLCGELVPSGYTHDCEKTGGITVRRTRKVSK